MAWETSDRRSRLPKEWPVLRVKILKRDKYRCTRDVNGARCADRATDVDHICPGDDHSEKNLTSLCGYHHRIKSSGEGAAALHERRKQIHGQFRRVEKHPSAM